MLGGELLARSVFRGESAAAPSRARMLGSLLLIGVPRARRPGLEALGVVTLRIPLQALLLSLLASGGLAFVARTPGAPADLLDRYGPAAALTACAFALEMNRFGFARYAASPFEALRLFTALTVLAFGAALLASGASASMTLAFAAAEFLASAALWYGLDYPDDQGVLLFGLVFVHAAVFVSVLLLTPPG